MVASMDGIRHAQRWRVAPWTVGSAEGGAGRRFTSPAVSPGAMWSFAGYCSFPNCSFQPGVRNAVRTHAVALWRCFSKAKEHSVCHGDDGERCPICLESLGENTATLPCGHTFHGPCLCKALWEKRCCPLCRLTPDDDESNTDVEEEPVTGVVPFTDAMKLAHVAAKTDKRTANMFNTVKKWEKKYKESKKLYIHTKRKLKIIRDVPVEQKVKDYRKKHRSTSSTKKHPKLLAKHKQSGKMRWWHADKEIDKAENRIAQKYGYIPWQRRLSGSVQRSS